MPAPGRRPRKVGRGVLVAIAAVAALAGVSGAAGTPLPDWHGDFRYGEASIESGKGAQYGLNETCHSPNNVETVCEGSTDSAITIVTFPVWDDAYAVRHVLVDDGITGCERASILEAQRTPAAPTRDGCSDPLFNGRERVQLGKYRYRDGTVRTIHEGDDTREVFYVMFRRWPSGHPGQKWCIFWEAVHGGPALHCNRNQWWIDTDGAFPGRCTIVADGTPPLNEWIRFALTVRWRIDRSGTARASMRSVASGWGGACRLRYVSTLDPNHLTVYPKWGYYRHWAWEHDVEYIMDGVCQSWSGNRRCRRARSDRRPPAYGRLRARGPAVLDGERRAHDFRSPRRAI